LNVTDVEFVYAAQLLIENVPDAGGVVSIFTILPVVVLFVEKS